MKIRKLDIFGFKSFVDRTVLHFDQDITAVVGPNGCGKSNIVDAIRWVMGEMSPKQLRGKAMDDVIFGGAESRGPVGFAEVSLTFENNDGMVPPEYIDYPEITVTRRLDRQGESEYLINKVPVRLKDVHELFLGTGVGRRAYSIVEQGRIGLIVSAKAEDRRVLLEEAAGITKFKSRKRSAELKMEHTRQNLLRLGDIISEIEKNLASLKRQARKAERYKVYREEIRDLELWVASHRYLELSVTRKVLDEQIEQATARAEGARLALNVREAELEAGRLALQQIEQRVERSQTRVFELENKVKLLQSEIEHHETQLPELKEREQGALGELEQLGEKRDGLQVEAAGLKARLGDLEEAEQAESEALQRENEELERRRQAADEAERALNNARARVGEAETRIARAEAVLAGYEKHRAENEARLGRLAVEREALRSRGGELGQQAEEQRARLQGLRCGKDELLDRRGQIEAELGELRENIKTSDGELQAIKEQLARKRSRLVSLKEIQQRFEGVGTGVRAVMSHFAADPEQGARAGVLGLVADRVQCPAELTQALAAVLGEKLQYVVIENLDAGMEALRYLGEGKHGRATLMPRVPVNGVRVRGELPAGDGVLGFLTDRIKVNETDRELVNHLLADVVLVEDLARARALHENGQTQDTLVTLEGEVIGGDGSLSGGGGEDGAHLLQIQREIRELGSEVEQLQGEAAGTAARHGELRNAIAQRQAALEATRTDAHQTELTLATTERDLDRTEQAGREANERLQALANEAEEIARSLEEARGEQGEAEAEREAAHAAESDARQAVDAAAEIHRLRRTSVEEQTAVVTEVRVRAAEARQKAESDREALDRLNESMQEIDGRMERLREDAERFSRQQVELAERVQQERATLAERVEEAMQANEEAASVKAEYDEAREELGEHELALRQVRGVIEQTTAQVNSLSLNERETSLQIDHLVASVRERHRLELCKQLGDFHAREIPDQTVLDRVDELQRVIERMGEINLMAIEEYEENRQRYEHLSEQRKDLETAIGQLESAIRKMNRESRRLFRETFEGVNQRFQKVFPRLFGGGKAELRLTNPDDLLETGIDIAAMPPGKRLGIIELMSGGEKAMTAISLLIALFQYKPSPFCLLDEVDAPLDEANIGRFCEIVQEMTTQSQFIVVTHSKRTIMMADVLYGLTMETPGISKLVSVRIKRDEQKRGVDGDGNPNREAEAQGAEGDAVPNAAVA